MCFPQIFSTYCEMIMRNLERYSEIKVGGHNVNSLRYADDTLLIEENKEDLQQLLNIVEEESRKKGLELNRKKTEMRIVSQNNECPEIIIVINGNKLKRRDQFR